MTSDTKQKILDRAGRLFFQEGFSTGIDRVVSECEVAKMTVYQHFKTKEGLICAILDEIQVLLRERIQRDSAVHVRTSLDRLEAACLTLCEAMHDPELRVGLVVRALIEFPSPTNPVHERARRFDLAILKNFESLCEDATLPNPRQAASQILQIAKGHFLLLPTVGAGPAEASTTALLGSVLAAAPPANSAPAETHRSRDLPASPVGRRN